MKSPARHHPRPFHYVLVLLLGLGMYVLLPQLASLQNGFAVLGNVDLWLVAVALATICLTFFIAAATYACLARSPLRYHRTVLVSVANMFTNRLLPAGTGSIATFFMYLRRNRHSATQAGSVIAVNNFLGFLAHASLLLLTVLLFQTSLDSFELPAIDLKTIGLAVGGIVVILLIVSVKKSWHHSFVRNARQLFRNIASYRHRPWRLAAAYCSSLLLTSCYALTLYVCGLAVGIELSIFAALAVFSIGILAGTATPTPGGLGGMEAGLLAGLIGFSIPADEALATVILFRLIGYWFTLTIGIFAWAYISRRGYLQLPVRR